MQSLEKEAAVAVQYLSSISKEVEAKFEEFLPSEKERPCRLHEAMRYSMFAGGKRLRRHRARLRLRADRRGGVGCPALCVPAGGGACPVACL